MNTPTGMNDGRPDGASGDAPRSRLHSRCGTHAHAMTDKTDSRPTRLLWVDVETTGLDPHSDRILEVTK